MHLPCCSDSLRNGSRENSHRSHKRQSTRRVDVPLAIVNHENVCYQKKKFYASERSSRNFPFSGDAHAHTSAVAVTIERTSGGKLTVSAEFSRLTPHEFFKLSRRLVWNDTQPGTSLIARALCVLCVCEPRRGRIHAVVESNLVGRSTTTQYDWNLLAIARALLHNFPAAAGWCTCQAARISNFRAFCLPKSIKV